MIVLHRRQTGFSAFRILLLSSVLQTILLFGSVFTTTTLAQAESAPSSCPNTNDDGTCTCLTGEDLRSRMREANDQLQRTGTVEASLDESLRKTIDDVIPRKDIDSLIQNLPSADDFVAGYQDNGAYSAPKAYSGLGLTELVRLWNNVDDDDDDDDNNDTTTTSTSNLYSNFLDLRQTVKEQAERALGLCPGTLAIHFTHVAQKTEGGQHRSHADSCFHEFVGNTNGNEIAKCDPSRTHPYSARVAASILYLNEGEDYHFDGGQFYWADRSTGEPEVVVEPKVGRFMVFTAGPENLHGALPVMAKDNGGDSDDPPRRLALAMWYILSDDPSGERPEKEPGTTKEEIEDDGYGRTELIRLPVTSMKYGGLKLALGLYLLGQQNTPSKGAWTLHADEQEGESSSSPSFPITISMVFQDRTTMISIKMEEDAVVVIRVTAEKDAKPSLMYQLQESVLLEGLLEELQSYASKDDIAAEQRLLAVSGPEVFDTAMQSLPAKRAK